MNRSSISRVAVAAVVAVTVVACNADPEARARQAVEKIKESIPDLEVRALAQKVSAEEVSEAQRALLAAKDYLGEVNGKLDSVTVNSLEAFQRSHGLTDDGILNDATKNALKAQLAQK